MSPATPTRRDRDRPTRRPELQPAALVGLTLVWLALWGDVTPMLVVSGLLVAVLVCVTFPLPRVELTGRIQLWLLLRVLGRFVLDVVRASLEVSAVVLRRRPVRNAVVAVDLESSSDFVLTLVAAMLSLVPGSVVVEARRSTHTLFLHVLDAPDQERVEEFRRYALALERRLLVALSARDLPAAGPDGAAR